MFRCDIRVSDAERGRVPCRSKEHTASTRQKMKPQSMRSGAYGAADGLEGGNPERARECISVWKRFPPQPQKASYRGVEGFVERLTGIEPAYQAWEACALPLSYSRIFFSVSRLLVRGETDSG